MTTTSQFAASSVGAAYRPAATDVLSPAPNYAVRRIFSAIVAAAVVLLLTVAAVTAVGALASLGGRPAVASETVPAFDGFAPTVHVAQPGDTLWSIADEYRGTVGRERFIDALVELNDGTAIQVGQAVRLP